MHESAVIPSELAMAYVDTTLKYECLMITLNCLHIQNDYCHEPVSCVEFILPIWSSQACHPVNSNDRSSQRMSTHIVIVLHCVWIQVRAWLDGIGMKCSLERQEGRFCSMFSFQMLSTPNWDGNEFVTEICCVSLLILHTVQLAKKSWACMYVCNRQLELTLQHGSIILQGKNLGSCILQTPQRQRCYPSHFPLQLENQGNHHCLTTMAPY